MTTEELIAARRAEPWREALRKSKKNKERADIPRVKMNELDPEYRSRTRLEEVNLGLTKEQAMQVISFKRSPILFTSLDNLSFILTLIIQSNFIMLISIQYYK